MTRSRHASVARAEVTRIVNEALALGRGNALALPRVVYGLLQATQQELHPCRKQSGQRALYQTTRTKKKRPRALFLVICRLALAADAIAATLRTLSEHRRRRPALRAFIGSPARRSTRSRNSLPGLKCGTNFSGTSTFSPDFGLRPTRDGRRLRPKLPKPRISMRWPLASASDIASSIVFTAKSASLRTSCGNRVASWATNSDLVILQQYLLRLTGSGRRAWPSAARRGSSCRWQPRSSPTKPGRGSLPVAQPSPWP